MIRVTKANPCPVCERPDWCLIADDGEAAICARVSEGSKKRSGDAGWLHVVGADTGQAKNVKFNIKKFDNSNTPKPDFEGIARDCQDRLSERQLRWLGSSLAITPASLQRLGVGWDGKAFSFPMFDENRKMLGIRRRFGDGNKRALTGSKTGLFMPADLEDTGTLLIAEGPTDCAAALDLGFNAIGRPNCNSKIAMTARFAKGRNAVIIADNDPPKENGRRPGKEGAENLAEKLLLHCPSVKIIYPPGTTKDLRQWLRSGLTSGQLQHVIDNTGHLTMELT